MCLFPGCVNCGQADSMNSWTRACAAQSNQNTQHVFGGSYYVTFLQLDDGSFEMFPGYGFESRLPKLSRFHPSVHAAKFF
eukprot:2993228-Amphidinium_carterae.1